MFVFITEKSRDDLYISEQTDSLKNFCTIIFKE